MMPRFFFAIGGQSIREVPGTSRKFIVEPAVRNDDGSKETTVSTTVQINTTANPAFLSLDGADVVAGTFSCAGTVSVGDVVYISANDTVDKALATFASGKYKAVGVVSSKPTATTCKVASVGEVPIAGLTAGSIYYLSTTVAGAVTSTASSTSGDVVKNIGVAKDANTLVVQVTTDYTIL
jgi:hypothetical protein